MRSFCDPNILCVTYVDNGDRKLSAPNSLGPDSKAGFRPVCSYPGVPNDHSMTAADRLAQPRNPIPDLFEKNLTPRQTDALTSP